MMKQKHLYSVFIDGELIGGAILFDDMYNPSCIIVGRIFIDTCYYTKGYGLMLMNELEKMFPNKTIWQLDTPILNVMKNSFYQKIGYKEAKRDNEFVYNKKIIK